MITLVLVRLVALTLLIAAAVLLIVGSPLLPPVLTSLLPDWLPPSWIPALAGGAGLALLLFPGKTLHALRGAIRKRHGYETHLDEYLDNDPLSPRNLRWFGAILVLNFALSVTVLAASWATFRVRRQHDLYARDYAALQSNRRMAYRIALDEPIRQRAATWAGHPKTALSHSQLAAAPYLAELITLIQISDDIVEKRGEEIQRLLDRGAKPDSVCYLFHTVEAPPPTHDGRVDRSVTEALAARILASRSNDNPGSVYARAAGVLFASAVDLDPANSVAVAGLRVLDLMRVCTILDSIPRRASLSAEAVALLFDCHWSFVSIADTSRSERFVERAINNDLLLHAYLYYALHYKHVVVPSTARVQRDQAWIQSVRADSTCDAPCRRMDQIMRGVVRFPETAITAAQIECCRAACLQAAATLDEDTAAPFARKIEQLLTTGPAIPARKSLRDILSDETARRRVFFEVLEYPVFKSLATRLRAWSDEPEQ